MALHLLEPRPETVVGYFDPDRPPILAIDPGDVVRTSTLDSGWHLPVQEQVADVQALARWPHRGEQDTGHALNGPIEVRGARAGQVLEIRVRAVEAGTWGWGGSGGRSMAHYLRPFPGVLGMPPPEPGRHSTLPPRVWGGNIDGAMLYMGDGHGTQGHGECSGAAIECPLSLLELEIDVLDAMPGATQHHGPRFLTADGSRGTLAFADSIDAAWPVALNTMMEWVAADTGRAFGHVLALSSVCADLHITQVVNSTVGVHCVWREL